MSEGSWLTERWRTQLTWRDGDLAWLGLLLSIVSASLMVGVVWWLVG